MVLRILWLLEIFFFFSSRRRHTRYIGDWSSDVCSSDLDTPGKLAAFAFAFEHLESAAYEQLRRVAERAGDPETASAAATILGEERAAAVRVAASFPLAAAASLDALDVQPR